MDSLILKRSVVVLWMIIFYGVPIFGLCNPEQVEFNSVCYQVTNMTGAAVSELAVDISDFVFFELFQHVNNPAFVSFDLDPYSGCSLRITALQSCNEGITSDVGCSWDGLNAGNFTLRSDQLNTTFNPTTPYPNAAAGSCGCDLFSNNGSYIHPVWYIRIENLNASTQNCTFDFSMSSDDVCSAHGNFSNGYNVSLPPITSPGTYCLCDQGYAGSQCQFDVTNISIGQTVSVHASANRITYFRFEHNNTGFQDIVFRTGAVSGNCSLAKNRIAYSCGLCKPAYPFALDANFTETFTQNGFNYSQYASFGFSPSFPVSLFEDIRDSCGCNVNNTLEEWFWVVDATQTNSSCVMEISVETQVACGRPDQTPCGGVGTCTSNLCQCPPHRQGIDCKTAVEKPKEIYNGVFYARVIKPRANVVTESFVTISPVTNRNVNINLNPFSGDVNGYLGAIETEGHPNPTVPTNGTIDQNGTMIFLARFSHPPEYQLLMDPIYYPSMAVSLNLSSLKFDYAATVQSQDGASVVIPINTHTPEKLYITVISLGTYSAIDSRPLEETDIEFVMYIHLEDNVALFIDVVLMIVFIAIVIFFCVAWKTCPSIFHSTMKKIIPELYYMEYKKKEQEQIERARVSSELAKTAAYVLAGTLYGLFELLCLIPFSDEVLMEDLPKRPTMDQVFNLMDNWMKNVSMPVIKLDVIPHNIPPRVLLQMMKSHVPNLSTKMKIPHTMSPTALFTKMSSKLPSDIANAEIALQVTSLPGIIGALSARLPDVAVIKEIGIELAAVSPTNIPLAPLPANMDVPSILANFKNSLSQIPGMTQDITLFLKINKLLSLPDIHGLTLQDLGLNTIPVSIPLKPENVQFPTVNVMKFKHEVSLSIEIECDVPKPLGNLDLIFKFIVGIFTISLQNLAFIFVEFLILMFNVAMIHSAFFEYPNIRPGMPDIEQVQAAFSNIVGDLGNFVYVISGFFQYLDFFFLLNSWNCGGTLTMITPFLFLFGAALTWVILEKDLLLYIAIKLKVHKPDPKSKLSMLASSVWMGISRVMVKVSILCLQAVILCLAQAVTKTTTNRTCNDIDLVANTFGKVIVAFFYVFFYVMFFFIFTGAPDWDRYKNYSFLPSVGLVFMDGLYRFALLTAGVWNGMPLIITNSFSSDRTVRAFNIIGRAQRYEEDLQHSPMDSSSIRLGASTPPAVESILKHSENNKQMKQALHEQIMHLIAISRTVVWIPLPLCVIVAKFSEALNTAIVFNFAKEEPIQLKRILPLRIFIWVFHVAQMPLLLSVVFTASKGVTIALAATLIPLASFRTVIGLAKLFVELFGSIKDVSIATSVIDMTDLA